MRYFEFLPCPGLRRYVKCYYLFESDSPAEVEDTVFPSGIVEIIFNLGEGIWKTAPDGSFHKTPSIELWGQVTRPLPVRSVGKQIMMGIRLYAHAPLYGVLNDQVLDAGDVLGGDIRELHARLLETRLPAERIALIEWFLLRRLQANDRLAMIGQILVDLHQETPGEIKTIASKYHVTPRYLQKLFVQHTGLTPKLYHQINRFQHSLRLVGKRESSLTSIAYDCGYFDQSHFIREFKSFTGIAPSEYTSQAYPVSVALSA